MEIAKGKNIAGIFKNHFIKAPIRSSYGELGTLFGEEIQKYVDGEKDLNSAIRDMEEAIIQIVKEKEM